MLRAEAFPSTTTPSPARGAYKRYYQSFHGDGVAEPVEVAKHEAVAPESDAPAARTPPRPWPGKELALTHEFRHTGRQG